MEARIGAKPGKFRSAMAGGKRTIRRLAAQKAMYAAWTAFRYIIACSLAFIFFYPVLFMLSQSFMRPEDIADATVRWLPRGLTFENFIFAYNKMDYWRHFGVSAFVSLTGALLQMIGCSLVGYGFARYKFPGYKLWMALLLLTFLVPPQSIMVPLYLFFSDLHWINSYLPIMVPSLFGHGLKGTLFALVFLQFFRGLPIQLEEAAKIDGAGAFRTFASIMLPLARPAILVVFLFSVVWNWNDTFYPNLYLSDQKMYTLNQSLAVMKVERQIDNTGLADSFKEEVIGQLPTNHEKVMAGALLSILPLLLLYLFAQKHFVEGVERTGIAGE